MNKQFKWRVQRVRKEKWKHMELGSFHTKTFYLVSRHLLLMMLPVYFKFSLHPFPLNRSSCFRLWNVKRNTGFTFDFSYNWKRHEACTLLTEEKLYQNCWEKKSGICTDLQIFRDRFFLMSRKIRLTLEVGTKL